MKQKKRILRRLFKRKSKAEIEAYNILNDKRNVVEQKKSCLHLKTMKSWNGWARCKDCFEWIRE
jgi:hypothetical protein